ncbi:MAG: Lar family restriction alleviation protein [Oscillospiraceae bacterium]|nr:Lar family restriction alleviation protein [Oscillospiraceae bacterium]
MSNTFFDLKPCPFCGGKASIIQKTGAYTGNPATILNEYVVGCRECAIYTPTQNSKIWQDHEGVVHVDRNGVEDAARIWNRRAEA